MILAADQVAYAIALSCVPCCFQTCANLQPLISLIFAQSARAVPHRGGHLGCPCRNPWSFGFKSDKAAHHIKGRFKQSANSLTALPLLVSSNQQHVI